MAKRIKTLTPPTGFNRFLFRAPLFIFKIGLGGLLGKRFLLLNHIGRKSGKVRQAVLEVVQHDPGKNTWTVMAGFGPKSSWYQNLLKTPDVQIQVGWKKMDMHARQLSADEAGEAILEFARNNPAEAKFVNLIGFEVDGSDEDYREVGRMSIMMRFSPRKA